MFCYMYLNICLRVMKIRNLPMKIEKFFRESLYFFFLQNILMTVWYDNDDPIDTSHWNTNMVIKACQAMDCFKEKFSVEFIIGSGSRVRLNIFVWSL